jgi:hypothetical protein
VVLLSTPPNNSIFSLNIHYKDQISGGLGVFDPSESSLLRAQGQFPNLDREKIELLVSILHLKAFTTMIYDHSPQSSPSEPLSLPYIILYQKEGLKAKI